MIFAMIQITKPKHGKFQPQNKRISFRDALNILHATYRINNNHHSGSQDNLPGRPPKIK
jgi:hypothetical protein